MKLNNTTKAIISIVGCELVGILGSAFTMSEIPTWYAGLNKSFINPPGWVFGPAWIILYALMGIALYLVWKSGAKRKQLTIAFSVFGLQLFLNTIWSGLFFRQHNPGLALIDIILMWGAIIATMILFHKISKPASHLLIPYILWVTFAGYLNYVVWAFNS